MKPTEFHLNCHHGSILNMRFTLNGSYILTCGQDRSVKLINPHKRTIVQEYERLHGSEVYDVAITQDNSKFFSVGGDRAIFLTDVANNKAIRRLSGHTSKIHCCDLNPTDEVLITGGDEGRLNIWDVRSQSKSPIQSISQISDSIYTCLMHGTDIILGCANGDIVTYDIRRGVYHVDNIKAPITSLSILKNNQGLLINTLSEGIKLLDRNNGELLNTFTGAVCKEYKINCELSNNNKWFACGSENAQVHFWRLGVRPQSLCHVEGGDASPIVCVRHHPNLAQSILAGNQMGDLWFLEIPEELKEDVSAPVMDAAIGKRFGVEMESGGKKRR